MYYYTVEEMIDILIKHNKMPKTYREFYTLLMTENTSTRSQLDRLAHDLEST